PEPQASAAPAAFVPASEPIPTAPVETSASGAIDVAEAPLPEPAASEASSTSKAAAPVSEPRDKALVVGDSYVVLGSYRDPEGPARRWSSLSAGAGDPLAGLAPVYDTRSGLHRVSVGPLAANDAAALCGDLGSDCFIERR
ncbi:MAG: hypothetical protein AAFU72_13835, partial [Pseudomonadota bacterium]